MTGRISAIRYFEQKAKPKLIPKKTGKTFDWGDAKDFK